MGEASVGAGGGSCPPCPCPAPPAAPHSICHLSAVPFWALCRMDEMKHAFHSFICLKNVDPRDCRGAAHFWGWWLAGTSHSQLTLSYAQARSQRWSTSPAPKVGAAAPRLMSQHHEVPYHNTNVGSVPGSTTFWAHHLRIPGYGPGYAAADTRFFTSLAWIFRVVVVTLGLQNAAVSACHAECRSNYAKRQQALHVSL